MATNLASVISRLSNDVDGRLPEAACCSRSTSRRSARACSHRLSYLGRQAPHVHRTVTRRPATFLYPGDPSPSLPARVGFGHTLARVPPDDDEAGHLRAGACASGGRTGRPVLTTHDDAVPARGGPLHFCPSRAPLLADRDHGRLWVWWLLLGAPRGPCCAGCGGVRDGYCGRWYPGRFKTPPGDTARTRGASRLPSSAYRARRG